MRSARLTIAMGVALGIAGCGSTRVVTQTVRVVTHIQTTVVAATPISRPPPLNIPCLTDLDGTFVSWSKVGAGHLAADFQQNSAKINSYWAESYLCGNSTQQLVCQLSYFGARAEVTLTDQSSDTLTAEHVCADFIRNGWHQS